MVKMSTSGHASDESEDAVTSSDSSADESSDNEPDDSSDSASVKSLAFTVRPRRSKVTVKSKKSNKRVRFKPGDSLVLIYIIPNREMLGLKSESEDSDEYEGSDDESGDEDDSDDGDDDDDDNTDDENDDDDEDDDNGNGKTQSKTKKTKPFAKLIAVKQVNKRKTSDVRNANKTVQEKPKEINTITNVPQTKLKKTPRVRPKREKKEPVKTNKTKDFNTDNKNKNKSKQYKTNNAIKVDKRPRSRRNRSRLLEIRATVESTNKTDNTHVVPKLTLKSDVKPSIIDVNSSVSTKQLTNRTRLQPTSFRITKPGSRPNSAGAPQSVSSSIPEKQTSVAKVVSGNYSSLTSVLPDSYVKFQSFQNNTVEETIKRLDPDCMNSSGKRNYAWQIANGTITSQSLRTPSILPFWDSLQNSVTENNTIKLPT
ncbi:hypothetical protein ACF0H5_004091 [Mactra antiquata]